MVNDFNLLETIKDEGMSYVLGELLGDAYDLYGNVEMVSSLLKSNDIPEQMIYSIQAASRSNNFMLRGLISKGITEDNYREAIGQVVKVFEYQSAIHKGFGIKEMDKIMYDYQAAKTRLNFLTQEIGYNKYTMEMLKHTKERLEAVKNIDDLNKTDILSRYEKLITDLEEKYKPVQVHFIMPTGASVDMNDTMYFDRFRVLAMENRTDRSSKIAEGITSFLPMGGSVISGAYNSLDAKGKSNIYQSIMLPNLFYQEKLRPEITNAQTEIDMFTNKIYQSRVFLDKAKEEQDNTIYLAIINSLLENDFLTKDLAKDYEHIESRLMKIYYIYFLSTDLYSASLYSEEASLFINNQLSLVSSIKNNILDPMNCKWDVSSFKEDLDSTRVSFIDVYKQIVDYSMDNNELEALSKGKSKIDYITPLGINGNKIYYDKKTLYDGVERPVKIIETEGADSDKPRYICYYSVTSTPCYVEDTKTGEYVYYLYTGMKVENNSYKRENPRIIKKSDNSDVIKQDVLVWHNVYTEIGKMEDSKLTALVDRTRVENQKK